MQHFFNAINNNTDITIGNSSDAQKLMNVIDEIYKSKEF
jgi:hypothetical protein